MEKTNYLRDVLIKEKNIVIYGASVIGQGLYCLLETMSLQKNVKGFAVSPKVDHLNDFKGIPIKCIDEYDIDGVYILLAVKERYKKEIETNLKTKKVTYVGVNDLLQMILGLNSEWLQNNKEAIQKAQLNDEEIVTFYVRQHRRAMLDFEVNLVDHCNLNCKCCNHFSPIAPPHIVSFDTIKKDMVQIEKLTGGNVGRIWLIGGEPLLHPQVTEIMLFVRTCFPKAHITLNTNGMLLLRQSSSFWETLRETNIELTLTKYPIAINYDEINQKMQNENIKYAYTISSQVLKTTYHLPLVENSDMDSMENYIKCWHANECVTLKDGRIYTCPIAPHAHYFNEYFDKNLYVGEQNSIDIYSVTNVDEILEFLKQPIPFCKHCDIKGYTYDLPWGISKKDISEWT